jgi:hypothetical protein
MVDDKKSDDAAHRARNRTVMLTPDITGEVRNRLAKDIASASSDGFVQPGKAPTSTPSIPLAHSPSATYQEKNTHSQVVQKVHKDIDNQSPLTGFLVSFDNGPSGEYFELRVGRRVITNDSSAQGQTIVIEHDTVSPMHAILRVAPNGSLQVLDQLSEHGTTIKRSGTEEEISLSGEKASLENGDIIKFGERKFIVCLISKVE